MKTRVLGVVNLSLVVLGVSLTGNLSAVFAASPKVEQALQLAPVQKGVDYDRPTAEEAAKCKIVPRKLGDQVGWVVEDANGTILRRFTDTNGDNVVDQWSYFKDGIEVYRDIDSNFNGKTDQYRWFNTAGSRWGLDKNEEGTIDTWKVISAEEVSAEIVAAMATQDVQRFARLALTADELKGLGLGETKASQISEKLSHLSADFTKLLSQQKVVTSTSRWLQFSAAQPGIVPAGTDGSTADVLVYENASAFVETDGKHGQVQLGTLIKVADAWRVINVPQVVQEGQELAATGFFFQAASAGGRPKAASTGATDSAQKLLAELEVLDKQSATISDPEQKAEYVAHRADLIEKIAEQSRSPEDRDMWMRQLADMISAAVQERSYPTGPKRLQALYERLKDNDSQKDMAAYVRFRQITAEYGQKLQSQGVDLGKVQGDWRKALEQYVTDYPKSPDTAEAMLQLAMDREFAGQEEDAKKWYSRIVDDFSSSSAARKATGARSRLELVGKSLTFRGRSTSGGVIDLAKYRGNVVLLQFWATWCEPCKADMAVLKDLLGKYGHSGFAVIGVSLDSRTRDLADYLAQNRLPWPQVYEEGGLDSRPANAFGILTVPTMILVDQNGRVVSRNIRTVDIEIELKKLIR
jgi:thiol-disulfide isomerase/thioredoxin